MRGGLFVAGVAIAVVGAGLMASLFFLPGTPTDTRYTSVSIADLSANATRSWMVSEETTFSGTLVLSWNSSAPVTVEFSKTSTCPIGSGLCPAGRPIIAWYGNLTGVRTLTGPVGSTYLLSVTNSGTSTLSFIGTVVESYNVPTPSQAVPAWALITLGGLVLLGIGAIATFLGLFLPSGVYRSSPTDLAPLDDATAEASDEFEPDPP